MMVADSKMEINHLGRYRTTRHVHITVPTAPMAHCYWACMYDLGMCVLHGLLLLSEKCHKRNQELETALIEGGR